MTRASASPHQGKPSMPLIRAFALVVLMNLAAISPAFGMEILGSLSLPNRTGVAVQDTVAFTVGGTGLTNVSIARPTSPSILGQLDLGMQMKGIAVQGDYAYCAGGAGGYAIVDISNPRTPVRVASSTVSGSCLDIAVDDTIFVLATGTEVWILGAQNPSRPHLLAEYGHAVSSVAIHWPTRRVYAGGSDGVIELNISNPRTPVFVSRYGAGQLLAPIAYSQPHVIAAQTSNLPVLNPNPLSLAGTFAAVASIRAVSSGGGYQSVIGLANGFVIHVGEAHLPPTQIASVNVGLEVRRIDTEIMDSGGLAVVATANGISIVSYEPISEAEPYHAQLTPGAFRISAYPNPFNSSVRLELLGAKVGWYVFELFDVTGRRVASQRAFISTAQEFVFEPSGLATGVYFARMTGLSGQVETKLIYLK
jgi:hypothetical protein